MRISESLFVGFGLSSAAGVRLDNLTFVVVFDHKTAAQRFYLVAAQDSFILRFPTGTSRILIPSDDSHNESAVAFPAASLRSFVGDTDAKWVITGAGARLDISAGRRSAHISSIPVPDSFNMLRKLAAGLGKQEGDNLTAIVEELKAFGDSGVLDTTIKTPGVNTEIVPLAITAFDGGSRGTILSAYLATPYTLIAAYARCGATAGGKKKKAKLEAEKTATSTIPVGETVIIPSTLMRVVTHINKPRKKGESLDTVTKAVIDQETNSSLLVTGSDFVILFRMAATSSNMPSAKSVNTALKDLYAGRRDGLEVNLKNLVTTVKSLLRVDSSDTATVLMTKPPEGAKTVSLSSETAGMAMTERLPFKAEKGVLNRKKGEKIANVSLLTRDLGYLSALTEREAPEGTVNIVFGEDRVSFRTPRSVAVFSVRA